MKFKLSHHHRVFLLLMVFSVFITLSFVLFQYHRESAVHAPVTSFTQVLVSDSALLIFIGVVTLIVAIIGYMLSRRFGQTITRLSDFARKAEHGEPIYDIEDFPAGELGEISHNIIRMYARLQRTMVERDKQQRQALHQEQEKIRIKRQLTNNINHELKTPVASIQICLETLLANPELSIDQRQDLIERSYEHCQRLVHLLGDVSQLTRMEEGAHQIQRKMVSLNNILEELADEMAVRPADRKMELVVNCPMYIDIFGNEALLMSIFRNLIDNSLAYSGGSCIGINVDVINSETLKVTFEDDGTGIDEQHLDHIFERFYRIDRGRSRRMGGTGLGLAIVKHAVDFHGGVITVSNVKPHGLRFEFTLQRGESYE